MSPIEALSSLPGVSGIKDLQQFTAGSAQAGANLGNLSNLGNQFGAQLGEQLSNLNVTAPTGVPVEQPLIEGGVGGSESPNSWGGMVGSMIDAVNSKQQVASDKVLDVLQGGPTPVHEATVATEEANLSFTFLAEVRNKVVEAYQQVMQMQV